jgi:hypothetical protein
MESQLIFAKLNSMKTELLIHIKITWDYNENYTAAAGIFQIF